MVQKSESRDLDKVIVRLPDGMRERIKHAAEANNRSMNAEIVERLEESLSGTLQQKVWDLTLKVARAEAETNGVLAAVAMMSRKIVEISGDPEVARQTAEEIRRAADEIEAGGIPRSED